MQVAGMPLGIHLGMPPQFSGRAPYSVERPFPVVRLRGLPFNAGELDILEFFQGLDPVDVLLTRRDGRSTGEAYVLFGTPMQMDFALQKNRQSMGRRYIEVFRAKKGDYYTAVAAHVSDPGPLASGPGMMTPGAASIPVAAMHAHAMVAYANHQLVAQPVGTDAMPAPITVAPGSGDSVHVAAATVLPVAVTAAPATSDGTAAGSPAPIPFPAFPSSGAVAVSGPAAVLPSVRDARQPRATEGNGGGGGGSSGSQAHTGVLKLRGLPFSASKDDIITFFDDPVLGVAALVHDSIHIVTSLDGRPSGVAFAEFASSDDARQAMRKDRCSMGSRYVELFPSSREEATRAATAAR